MAAAAQTSNGWHLLPPDLLELQLGQIDLLLAMYPDESIIEESSQEMLDCLRKSAEDMGVGFDKAPYVSVLLRIAIQDSLAQHEALQLNITFPFTFINNDDVHDPPPAKIRAQQPSWLSRVATARMMHDAQNGEDLFSTLEQIREQANHQLDLSNSALAARSSVNDASEQAGPLVRVWFYFPSISTRSKRDDFITNAPSYHLTGFLYAGKPGLLCVEGASQSIDDYMKFIKTESWGDIPAHHKKVSERLRERIEERAFADMTETTNTVGERHGQRANRGDMKAVEEWLIERGLGDAFAKVLM